MPCVPSLADLPEPVDAVVVAIPAAGVPDVRRGGGRGGLRRRGRVRAPASPRRGGARARRRALRAAARRHGLPVFGPNGNGIVALHERAALWGDALAPREPGRRRARLPERQRGGQRARARAAGCASTPSSRAATRRCSTPPTCSSALAEDEGVRSIALYLEDDGDGARLCAALARCAERGVGVAVLKAGASARRRDARPRPTPARSRATSACSARWSRRPARPGRATSRAARAGQGAGRAAARGAPAAARRRDPHLLGRRLAPSAADEAARLGARAAAARAGTPWRGSRALLPGAATVAQPARLHGDDLGRARRRCGARDRASATTRRSTSCSCFYDQPAGIDGGRGESWDARARRASPHGAAASAAPVLVASTLPELLDDAAAPPLPRGGRARASRACAPALRVRRGAAAGRPATAARLARDRRGRRGARAAGGRRRRLAGRARGQGAAARRAASPVVRGRASPPTRTTRSRRPRELGGPVALKRSAPALQHKSEAGALALGVADEATLRSRAGVPRGVAAAGGAGRRRCWSRGWRRRASSCSSPRGATRSCPALVVGLGGIWTELLDDVALVPLPASPERVEARSARCAARRCSPARAAGRASTSAPPRELAAARRRRCCSPSASTCSSSTR